MAKIQASETLVESAHRREMNRAGMAKKRASEIPVESAHKQKMNQAGMVQKRTSETPEEIAHRREMNRACMAEKRASIVPIEKCIADFQTKTKLGLEFVYTCCHRMMYKQTVVPYNRSK